MRTESNPSVVIPDTKAGEKLELASSESSSSTAAGSAQSSSDPDAKPASKRQEQNEADAPLVFSGLERAKAKHSALPPPVDEVAALHLTVKPPQPPAAVIVLPPAPDPKSTKKGFFGKVKGFFGSIFH
jgi:hypothetical protein